MKKIRTLKASEIEVRPSHTKNGVSNHLLYINSRAATTLLDETYGMENWNLEYKDVNNTIYGRLSIWDEQNNRYVYREDTGEEANISKDKSIASDILKRLIVRFGVTELYTSPKIQIPDDGYGNTGYKVAEISYNKNREITNLIIVNRFDKIVFTWNIHQPNNNHSTVIYDTKQLINETQTSEDLEWKPEGNFVAKVEMTKTLTPADELKNWYETTTHTPVVDKFYTYWHNRLTTNGWTGTFNLQTLIQKYCK